MAVEVCACVSLVFYTVHHKILELPNGRLGGIKNTTLAPIWYLSDCLCKNLEMCKPQNFRICFDQVGLQILELLLYI